MKFIMDFIADIIKKLALCAVLAIVFVCIVDMFERMDERSPQQKIADQITELKNKTTIEKNELYADCEVVSVSYPIPNMTILKSVFFKRGDGTVFSALTEHEFRLGEKVKIVTIFHRTGHNWESSFLLAVPANK